MSAAVPCLTGRHLTVRVVREHLETFLVEARGRGSGDGLPRFVERELREFLTCGVLARGFAHLRCDGCRAEMLMAFSCKGRGFWPSCCGRRMAERAAHLRVKAIENRKSKMENRDFLHKMGIKLKELQETRYWLRVVAGTHLTPAVAFPDVLAEVDALCRILAASKRTARLNTPTPRNGTPARIR